uniref:ABC1 atypical kinase-like domain-containing protein n=1 Tax=Hemiselmis andersenii TaxID=464988 RepID=A0A7S1DQW9_HEMAN
MEEEHRREIERRGLVAASRQDLRIRAYHAATLAIDFARNAPAMLWNVTVGLVWRGSRRGYTWTPVMVNMAAMLDLLLQVHAYEVLICGCFNGDPHPGNILLMPDGRLGLIDYGSCVNMDNETRVKLARLIVALAKGTPERVSQISAEEMGVVTARMLPEIHYRSAAFWYDRDDVTNGMNVHKFLEWLHEQDPIVKLPDEFVMAGRVSVLLRGMGAAFGLKVSVAKAWVGYAEELLRSQGLSEGGVRV